jgi:hypothetical protein
VISSSHRGRASARSISRQVARQRTAATRDRIAPELVRSFKAEPRRAATGAGFVAIVRQEIAAQGLSNTLSQQLMRGGRFRGSAEDREIQMALRRIVAGASGCLDQGQDHQEHEIFGWAMFT